MNQVERHTGIEQHGGADEVSVADNGNAPGRVSGCDGLDSINHACLDVEHRLASGRPCRSSALVPCLPSRVRSQGIQVLTRPFSVIDLLKCVMTEDWASERRCGLARAFERARIERCDRLPAKAKTQPDRLRLPAFAETNATCPAVEHAALVNRFRVTDQKNFAHGSCASMKPVGQRVRLRPGEWVQIGFFVYVAIVAAFFPLRPSVRVLPPFLPFIVGLTFVLLARARSNPAAIARDWFALAFTLLAYREMDWFTPERHLFALEQTWIVWDRKLLYDYGLQRLIESAGVAIPILLEWSYLFVYAIGPFGVAMLYAQHKADRTWILLLFYLLGTLLAYALFPYFPSEPPRRVFPGQDLPNVDSWLRQSNLRVLGGYGIHSSVFPSAHVSSAFSAAFGMLVALPEKKRIGWWMLVYACLVSLATIYGRYHYAVDAVAGLGVSLVALASAAAYVKSRSV